MSALRQPLVLCITAEVSGFQVTQPGLRKVPARLLTLNACLHLNDVVSCTACGNKDPAHDNSVDNLSNCQHQSCSLHIDTANSSAHD